MVWVVGLARAGEIAGAAVVGGTRVGESSRACSLSQLPQLAATSCTSTLGCWVTDPTPPPILLLPCLFCRVAQGRHP